MARSSDQQFFKTIFKKAGQAINDYQLIKNEDKIIVGLSGGKDSLALLDILSGRKKYAHQTFSLEAIHINIKSIPYQIDNDYIRRFCEEREVPFHLVESDQDIRSEKNPCFACSWNRRKLLFDEVQKRGFNKLALGHHINDAVETLLMNMVFQGSISSMPPSLAMFEGKLEIIRPLILLSETEIAQYASVKNFKTQIKNCPFEKESQRNNIKQLINNLQKEEPHICNNIYASMSNIQKEYLPPHID